MTGRFPPTTGLVEARHRAQEIAREYPHECVEPIHALKAILVLDGSPAALIVDVARYKRHELLGKIDLALDAMPAAARTAEDPPPSGALKAVFQQTEVQCEALGDQRLGEEHLLLALCGVDAGLPGELRKELALKKRILRQAMREVDPYAATSPADPDQPAPARTLEFCEDVTTRAEQGELDPVIGRDREIAELAETLARRTKSNAMLVGPPGTGKTAIVEGFALLLASPHAPGHLKGARVFGLDLASMVAGAKYKGEFEERFKKLLKDMAHLGDRAILFVDEMHTLMGVGKGGGGIDAANMLKPALARGEVRLVGTTTTDEYREYVEKDKAFDRRFSTIYIDEPDDETALEILEGLAPRYAEHHEVEIQRDALVSAVRLSRRYIPGRYLPDKAVDLMDSACADVRVLAQQAEAWRDAEGEEARTTSLDMLREAVRNRGLELPDSDDAWSAQAEQYARRAVDRDVVARRVSRRTGVPVHKMTVSDRERLRNLESHLQRRVVGQDDAIDAVARAIRRARTGMKQKADQPDGSFLFLGPTGTGKTELAKTLAEFLFADETAMVRIDMSEYKGEHATERLTGSPPGYVGYEQGGTLTEALKHRPYSVILFDEVDKADPRCLDILLQITDDGRLTDGKGTTVDCSNSIVILTSNFQGTWIAEQLREKGEIDRSVLMKRLIDPSGSGRGLRPEFFGRLSDSIVFRPLPESVIRMIVDLQTDRLIQRVAEQGISLYVTSEARDLIAREGYVPELGARPVRGAIDRRIVDPLAFELSGLESSDGVEATVSAVEGSGSPEIRVSLNTTARSG